MKKDKTSIWDVKPSLNIAGVISRSSFLDEIYGKPSQESIDKYERAFNARLAYEKNCIAKYDYPDNRPSKPPVNGERMEDFACRFGTTIKEMKDVEMQVEVALQNGL
jgi:hypothetical protein